MSLWWISVRDRSVLLPKDKEDLANAILSWLNTEPNFRLSELFSIFGRKLKRYSTFQRASAIQGQFRRDTVFWSMPGVVGDMPGYKSGSTILGDTQKGDNMSEERELKLYDIMDKYNVDMDTAELLLQDEEEKELECED